MSRQITYEEQEILNTIEVLGDFACKRKLGRDDLQLIKVLLQDAALIADSKYQAGLELLANNFYPKLQQVNQRE
jgi:hypothetical protein